MEFTNVLNDVDISLVLQNETVTTVLSSGATKTRFRLALPDTIKEKLKSGLGLDLFSVPEVPMMYIRGDMEPHVDSGVSDFKNTYLVYLTDSGGKFVVGDVEHDIKKGCGFVFQRGLSHGTTGTEGEGRLMIGPLSDIGLEVGGPSVYYFSNLTDANTIGAPTIGETDSYIVGTYGGYSSWKITSFRTTGSSPGGNNVYNVGDELDPEGAYFLYPAGGPAPCFLEGSTILCLVNGVETYVPIEKIRPGTLVKTRLNGYKAVDMIGHSKIYNPANSVRSANRLYLCSKDLYPELIEDLVITGYHSILVDTITDTQKEKIIEHVNRIFVTDKKYRLLACVDERAKPYVKEGVFPIWHLALENDDYYMNYGIWANGLLVETTSKRYLKELSGMTLV
jgi:hypothetical protein